MIVFIINLQNEYLRITQNLPSTADIANQINQALERDPCHEVWILMLFDGY